MIIGLICYLVFGLGIFLGSYARAVKKETGLVKIILFIACVTIWLPVITPMVIYKYREVQRLNRL